MDRDKIKLDWWGVPAVTTRLAMILAGGIFVLPLLGQSSTSAENPVPGAKSAAAGAQLDIRLAASPGVRLRFGVVLGS
jgi:hypothetical protein